jgi:hypothetical protein
MKDLDCRSGTQQSLKARTISARIWARRRKLTWTPNKKKRTGAKHSRRWGPKRFV